MVGELLALRVRVIEVSLGVKLVLEGMVVRLDMVVIAAVAVFVGVKLVVMVVIAAVAVFVGVKLVESVFVGTNLVLEVMVVRLDMVVIAAGAVSVGEL